MEFVPTVRSRRRSRRAGAPGLRPRRIGTTVQARPLVVAATTGTLFLGGGLLVLLAALADAGRVRHLAGLVGIALLAVVVGLATLGLRRRLPPEAAHLLVALGTLLITLAVHLAGATPTAVAIAGLYVLVAVDSAFFFSRPAALAHMVLAAAACLGVSASSPAFDAGAAVMVCGTALLVAGVVAWLVRAAAAAELDALTGLPNRRGLDRGLDRAVADAARTGEPFSLALLDLDHFKAVNDGQGHDVGDRLLVEVAAGWRALLEPGQVLARSGGDEFVLLLPGLGVADAVGVVERLVTAMPARRTFSAGVAEWDPEESVSLLLSSADGALYQAKRDGRDCVRAYHRSSSHASALRGAVRAGELRVHYQPIVDGSGRPVAAEALVRWQHPERGLLPPGAFLPAVDTDGVMLEVGGFVLTEACRQVARWRACGGPAVVSVNVSGPELLSDGYVDRVARDLADAGVPAEALVLEVTETSLNADAAEALVVLEALRALGVRIAVDDFGTGYSNLGRLGRLPVDILKVDRSLVIALTEDARSAALVKAVLAMARAMGLAVVVEGVETELQAGVLRAYGCRRLQGYLYGRPGPADVLVPGPAEVAAAAS